MDENITITISLERYLEIAPKLTRLLKGEAVSRQAEYQKRKAGEKPAKKPAAKTAAPYRVWEVEPSLAPAGVRDTRTLLVNQCSKEELVPAYQDMSGVDADDPANETLLASGNRFYGVEVGEYASEGDAVAAASDYARAEGIDLSLPTRFPEYYAVAGLVEKSEK